MLCEEDKIYETIFFEKGEFEGRECDVFRIDCLALLNISKSESRGEFEKLKDIDCRELQSVELLDSRQRLERRDSDNSSAIALRWRKEVKGMLNT